MAMLPPCGSIFNAGWEHTCSLPAAVRAGNSVLGWAPRYTGAGTQGRVPWGYYWLGRGAAWPPPFFWHLVARDGVPGASLRLRQGAVCPHSPVLLCGLRGWAPRGLLALSWGGMFYIGIGPGGWGPWAHLEAKEGGPCAPLPKKNNCTIPMGPGPPWGVISKMPGTSIFFIASGIHKSFGNPTT